MPRSGGARLGATAPWGLLNAGPGQQEPNLDAELAAYVRRQRDLLTVNALRPAQEGGAQVQPNQPPVVTVQDHLAISADARKGAQEVAEMARKRAEDAQAELDRVKQDAGGAYEAGKQEALTVWQMIDERDARAQERQDALEKALREQTTALETQLREAREEAREARSQAQLTELSAKIDKLEQSHTQQVSALTARAEKAEQQAAEAGKPKTPAEMAISLMVHHGKTIDSPEVQVLLGRAPTTGEESFDATWRREMGALEIAKVKRQHNKDELLDLNAVEHDQAVKAQSRQLLGRIDQLLDLGQKWLAGNLGMEGGNAPQAAKAGLPHNGFGGTMEEIASQAQQVAQAQAAQQGGAE